jgi:hypothetical protein
MALILDIAYHQNYQSSTTEVQDYLMQQQHLAQWISPKYSRVPLEQYLDSQLQHQMFQLDLALDQQFLNRRW